MHWKEDTKLTQYIQISVKLLTVLVTKFLSPSSGIWALATRFFRWIESYLSDRQQFVTVNGANSDLFSVPSGVPQGSHFGPLLFLLFINDLPDRVRHGEIILCADDAKIFKIIESSEDALLLQKDLDEVFTSSFCNKLPLI